MTTRSKRPKNKALSDPCNSEATTLLAHPPATIGQVTERSLSFVGFVGNDSRTNRSPLVHFVWYHFQTKPRKLSSTRISHSVRDERVRYRSKILLIQFSRAARNLSRHIHPSQSEPTHSCRTGTAICGHFSRFSNDLTEARRADEQKHSAHHDQLRCWRR